MLKWFDGSEFDIAAIPGTSVESLAARGLRVVMQNEAGASVVARIRKAIVGESDRKLGDVTSDEVAAFRKANESECAKWLVEEQSTRRDAIIAGELGRSDREPSLSAVERARREAAKRTILALWAAQTKRDGKARGFVRASKGGLSKAEAEARREERITAFLAGLAPDGAFHKFAKRFESILAEVQAESGSKSSESSDDLADLAA